MSINYNGVACCAFYKSPVTKELIIIISLCMKSRKITFTITEKKIGIKRYIIRPQNVYKI